MRQVVWPFIISFVGVSLGIIWIILRRRSQADHHDSIFSSSASTHVLQSNNDPRSHSRSGKQKPNKVGTGAKRAIALLLTMSKDNRQELKTLAKSSNMGKEQNQMTETTEILIHVMEQQLSQVKQSEDQRSNITSVIVLIAAAIQGGLTQTGFTKNSLPLTITLIITGIFGVIATAKLYERSRYHYEVMRQIRKKLEELCPSATIRACLDTAWQEHIKKHPVASTKIRLYMVWSTLHILIVALGVIYTFIILIK